MDRGGDAKRERRSDEDRLSNLPESLLCQIMLNIPTKDVVKSSVLSRRWRNLWRYVPGLNVEYSEFLDYNAFVSFVDRFLGVERESCFERFRLRYDCDEEERTISNVKRWINIVVNQKLKVLDVLDYTWGNEEVQIPPSVYTCESLVSMKLCNVILPNPQFISLPLVKAIELDIVKFANALVLEELISSCSALESLIISRSSVDDIDVLRVRSRSLLRFKHIGNCSDGWDGCEVAIEAPKLEYLNISDHSTAKFRIKNSGSLVEANINIIFNMEELPDPNNRPKRKMIQDFLAEISSVKKLFISSHTLEVIFDLSCELPVFHNLSSLHIDFEDHSLTMLSTFLQSCPNLKSLVVEFKDSSEEDGVGVLSIPRCFSTTLEYVKIERPITGEARGMKLVSYILENSAILKKLTLSLKSSREKEESVILKELLTISRLSTSCKVVVSEPRSCWVLA
ncbi:FBD domain [Arabidopsis thaliana x Arabidopsis arenosa]|uniref:FBD domain n=1 Tax=Arabidopsis thaliana x Arabidopsis arenosa TaxID=1240361 RepID=A0A8T2BJD1_9BRAS|nr:FBD domain [Arabidopsis thaliana x Arabidopsis arenosa]